MTHRIPMMLIAFLLCLALASCAAVRGRRAAPEPSGFLGDYSQLREDPQREVTLAYIDATAAWSRYDAVHLESVTLWATSESARLGETPPSSRRTLARSRPSSRSMAM